MVSSNGFLGSVLIAVVGAIAAAVALGSGGGGEGDGQPQFVTTIRRTFVEAPESVTNITESPTTGPQTTNTEQEEIAQAGQDGPLDHETNLDSVTSDDPSDTEGRSQDERRARNRSSGGGGGGSPDDPNNRADTGGGGGGGGGGGSSGPNVSTGPSDQGDQDVVDVSGGEIFGKKGASVVEVERDLATPDNSPNDLAPDPDERGIIGGRS